MNWWVRHRFQALLLALLLLLVVYPLLRDAVGGRILFDALFILVFLAALLVGFTQKPLRLVALLLFLPTMIGTWTGYVIPGLPPVPLTLAFHLCATLFLGFMVAVILQTIFGEKSVSADSIYGALCGYLLAGVVFGHLYCVLEILTPGSFSGGGAVMSELGDQEPRLFLLTYFSLITVTTVGYGDITPVSSPARGLAALEAVLGQIYIAVLIAELIGKRVSQTVSDQQADSQGRHD
jgi:hypothetical protein